jgi:hypothetical protein
MKTRLREEVGVSNLAAQVLCRKENGGHLGKGCNGTLSFHSNFHSAETIRSALAVAVRLK